LLLRELYVTVYCTPQAAAAISSPGPECKAEELLEVGPIPALGPELAREPERLWEVVVRLE